MGRRVGLFVCLFLCLAGGPLRQAEAAGDLARSLAEFDADQNLEPVDGGVGDEPADAVIGPVSSALTLPMEHSSSPSLDGWIGVPAGTFTWVIDAPGEADRLARPLRVDRAHERARLQRFLF